VKDQLERVRQEGHAAVRVLGEGDIADICRLTCLEQNIMVTTDERAPALEVRGTKVLLHLGQTA
jgi:hypothetical protein